MPSRREFDPAEQHAPPARDEPFLVHLREAAKAAAAYQTDPEILLGCMIVSGAGTLDTGAVLKTHILLTHGLANVDDWTAFEAFRRVWKMPTEYERTAVLDWAERIAERARHRHPAAFKWNQNLWQRRHRPHRQIVLP